MILHDPPPSPRTSPRQSPPQTRAVISTAETPACRIPAAATPASVQFPAVLSQHSLRGCVVSCRPAAISRPPLNGWYKKAGDSLDHSLVHSLTHSLAPPPLNLPLDLHTLLNVHHFSRNAPPHVHRRPGPEAEACKSFRNPPYSLTPSLTLCSTTSPRPTPSQTTPQSPHPRPVPARYPRDSASAWVCRPTSR